MDVTHEETVASGAQIVSVVIVAVWLTVIAVILGIHVGTTIDRHARTQRACLEDEACWDCMTMGNHVCGPTTRGSTP